MVYERKDSVVRGVGLTCELSLVTVTHILLCNLISSHLHDTGLDHILNVLHVYCVGHRLYLFFQVVCDGVNLVFVKLVELVNLVVGSLDGILYLRQIKCHLFSIPFDYVYVCF